MTYPTLVRGVAQAWFREWTDACLNADLVTRVEAPSLNKGTRAGGKAMDWDEIVGMLCGDLLGMARSMTNAEFEASAPEEVHRRLPDEPALRDPEFWIWAACGPGRNLVLERYAAPEQTESTSKSPLPAADNFFSQSARETFLYRLWIRAEMACEEEADDPYERVRVGDVDFWRSHVFRQLYGHYRPFVWAFVDFQFPIGSRGRERFLDTPSIRMLAKELSLTCANVTIEALNYDGCMDLIRRVYGARVKGIGA